MKRSKPKTVLKRKFEAFRSHHGISQAEMAARYNITASMLSRMEGGSKVRLSSWTKLAKGTGVRLEFWANDRIPVSELKSYI